MAIGSKTKASQFNPKDRSRLRPCSPKARPRSRPQLDQTNNFSVNHKKILCRSDTDKRKHLTYMYIYTVLFKLTVTEMAK